MADSNTESDQKKNPITNEESEFSFLEWAINKMVDLDYQFTFKEYIHAYTVVFNMTESKEDAQRLYEKYKKTLEDYVSFKVLPHLKGKSGEILWKEFVKQWDKYKTLQKRLFGWFCYLDRYYIPSRGLPSLKKTSHSIFRNLVFPEFDDWFMETDNAATKKSLEIFVKRIDNDE